MFFRKKTFTGLGLNFFSHCSLNFKLNSCKTLIFRAFSITSNWCKFHDEVESLKKYFTNNCYPLFIFEKILNRFLYDVFNPKIPVSTVPKKVVYVSLPFINTSSSIKNELTKILCKLYPYVDFRFVFKNPLTIGSLFHFKDPLPELMRAGCVYLYTCPNCKSGTYIGCTKRLLKVRVDAHRGVSYRTGSTLSNKEHSAIRNHAYSCKKNINYDHFKILSQAPNQQSLLLFESLYIKHLSPSLNNQTTSVPLHIA